MTPDCGTCRADCPDRGQPHNMRTVTEEECVMNDGPQINIGHNQRTGVTFVSAWDAQRGAMAEMWDKPEVVLNCGLMLAKFHRVPLTITPEAAHELKIALQHSKATP